MRKIRIESQPIEDRLSDLEVYSWPVWEKEVSEFDWEYDDKETCYILEGEATITSEEGEAVTIGKRDLVIFPKGMKCHWKITSAIKKYYTMG